MLFDIQRFATHDGAGIRTTAFFKGCPLRCGWCENPESQHPGPELAYDARKCIGCLDCVRAAPNGEIEQTKNGIRVLREKVSDASVFARVCPTGALTVVGEDRSIEDIMMEIAKDLPFYKKSGGGVTFSGGEPYAQPALMLALLKGLEAIGQKATIETTLHTPWTVIEQSLPFVDRFLADIKHRDADKLKAATGANLALIDANFYRLASAGASVIARVPVIPGFNDSLAEIKDIIDFAASLDNIREMHFLGYHTLGVVKYRLLDRECPFNAKPVQQPQLERFREIAERSGLAAIVGG